jgi:hypothetical protein
VKARDGLPTELVALAHYVELNRAGWWDKALEQMVIAAIWLSGSPLSEIDIFQTIRRDFSARVDKARVLTQIETMASKRLLFRLDDKYKISDELLKEYEQSLSKCEDIERAVRSEFDDIIIRNCPFTTPELLWDQVVNDFIIPLVHDMGARTYELLSGGRVDFSANTRFKQLLERYDASKQEVIRESIIEFMDPKDDSLRSFILQRLNAYFFLQSGNLSESIGQNSEFRVLKPILAPEITEVFTNLP